LVNTSPQNIYQKIEKSLKSYLIIENGKKYISYKALKEIYNIDIEQEQIKNAQKIEKELINQNKTIEILQELTETLKNQLEEKDTQIKELLKVLDQQQQLNVIEHQKILEIEEKKEEKKPFFKRLFNKN